MKSADSDNIILQPKAVGWKLSRNIRHQTLLPFDYFEAFGINVHHPKEVHIYLETSDGSYTLTSAGWRIITNE